MRKAMPVQEALCNRLQVPKIDLKHVPHHVVDSLGHVDDVLLAHYNNSN